MSKMTAQVPSPRAIEKSCEQIQRHWTDQERALREVIAAAKTRCLLATLAQQRNF